MATIRPSAAIQIVRPPTGPSKPGTPGPKDIGGQGQAGAGIGGGLNVNAATFGGAPPSPDRRKGVHLASSSGDSGRWKVG